MEYKYFQGGEIKAVNDDKHLYIEGYAAYFGNVDSYGDILMAGSCIETISGAEGKRIKLCEQHDMDHVIGKIIELKEDGIGLWFKAKISNTSRGKDVAELIKDEALNEFSIGYSAVDWAIVGDTRELKKIKLYEISVVSRAANAKAVLLDTEVKQEDQANEQVEEQVEEQVDEQKEESEKECKPKRKLDDADLSAMSNEDIQENYKKLGEEIYKRIIINC